MSNVSWVQLLVGFYIAVTLFVLFVLCGGSFSARQRYRLVSAYRFLWSPVNRLLYRLDAPLLIWKWYGKLTLMNRAAIFCFMYEHRNELCDLCAKKGGAS
jgi:hypothetical protein